MEYVNELIDRFSVYNLNKLEIIRIIKFIKQLVNYNNIENEKNNNELLEDNYYNDFN